MRTGFDRLWARGFEVVAVEDEGDRYLVRRLSDGWVLPRPFGRDEIRRERRDANLWWV